MAEFSNTDAEITRMIKARLRHELGQSVGDKEQGKKIIREYLTELTQEIINEEF